MMGPTDPVNGETSLAEAFAAPGPLHGVAALARPITAPSPDPRPLPLPALLLMGESARQAWVDMAVLIVILAVFEWVSGVALGEVFEVVFGVPASTEGPLALEVQQVILFPTLFLRGLGGVALVALILRCREQSAAALGVAGSRWGRNVAMGVAAVIAAYGVIFLSMGLLWLSWPGLQQQMAENSRRIMGVVPRVHPLLFIPVALLIGVYEEVLFRGFLMCRLRRASGSWTFAVVMSTMVFTTLHAFQTPAALIVVAILALVFSLVTIWRRSLIPAIVAHTLFDLSQFLLLYYTAGETWT